MMEDRLALMRAASGSRGGGSSSASSSGGSWPAVEGGVGRYT